MSCGGTMSSCFSVFLAVVVFLVLGAVFLAMWLSSTCFVSNIFLSSLIFVTVGVVTFPCSLMSPFNTGGTACDGCCSLRWLYFPVVVVGTLGGCWGWGVVAAAIHLACLMLYLIM